VVRTKAPATRLAGSVEDCKWISQTTVCLAPSTISCAHLGD